MTPLIPDSSQVCPVCSSPGAPCGWRSLSIVYRCQVCGQTFILDSLGSLEEDLSQEVSR